MATLLTTELRTTFDESMEFSFNTPAQELELIVHYSCFEDPFSLFLLLSKEQKEPFGYWG